MAVTVKYPSRQQIRSGGKRYGEYQLYAVQVFMRVLDPSSNAVDLTVSGYVYDSVLEDMKEIFETVDLLNIYATVDSQIHIDIRRWRKKSTCGG